MGVRSIILKPEPIYVKLEHIYAVGTNLSIVEELKKHSSIPVINQERIYPNRVKIDIRQQIDEKIDMLSFVNMANEKLEKDYQNYKDVIFSLYESKSLMDVAKNSIYWEYDKEGTLTLAANSTSRISIRMPYYATETSRFECNTFNEGFHKLVGLNYHSATTNINTLLSLLCQAYVATCPNEQKVIKTMADNGITIGTYTVRNDPLDTNNGQPRYWELITNSITFSNVWSRKDVLLTSSISEMDKRGYLGFSSNFSNSAQAIYPQPKMFDINNTETKFWVDLYDSYTQKSIKMLGGNLLLIEAIVVQKPKRTFNRT